MVVQSLTDKQLDFPGAGESFTVILERDPVKPEAVSDGAVAVSEHARRLPLTFGSGRPRNGAAWARSRLRQTRGEAVLPFEPSPPFSRNITLASCCLSVARLTPCCAWARRIESQGKPGDRAHRRPCRFRLRMNVSHEEWRPIEMQF
jgi:hypothetical protein